MRSLSAFSRSSATILFFLISVILLQGLSPPDARAQNIPGRRLEDIYINARFHDGYWEWYHEYLQEREELRAQISELRMVIAVLAAERKKLRAEWLRYLYLENQLTPKSEYDQGWIAYLGEIAGEWYRDIDDFAVYWTAGLWGAPLTPEGADAALELSYQNRRDELRARINMLKEEQGYLIDEALGLNAALEQLCYEQKQKSRERRPWLNAEYKRVQDDRVILEVELYDAAQWYLPDELPALIDRLDLDNTATEEVALFFRAKVALAEAAWNDEKNWLQLTSPRQAPPDPAWVRAARVPRLQAVVDLRRVIELNPEHAEARGMLMEVELYWLREIAAKVDLESRASVQAFRQYISARGFYADQPEAWYQPAFEVISAVWGLGPIALASGLPGLNVADARATELDVTQTSAARNQVSLLAIMRLVKNGVPLAEISGMTYDQVAEVMTMHTADGQPLPDNKARQVVADIHATFADLEDLKLLADGDPLYLVEDVNRAYGKTYYAPLDPTYTWYESFGDLLNLHNVCLLWGPGSVAKIDDEWVGLQYLSGNQIQAAEQAGTLLTGKQWFFGISRLDRLAATLAKTSIGSRLVAAAAADRAAMAAEGTLMRLANMGGRLGSALIIYGGATYVGTQMGIPGIGLLVEVIGEIGPVDMLSDVVRRANVPVEKLINRIDEFGEFLIRQQDELAASSRYLNEVAELGEELSDEAINASRRAAIEARLDEIVEEVEEIAANRLPGSVAEPVDEATRSAAQSLKSGDNIEAESAISGATQMAEEVGTKLDEATNQVSSAAAKLRQAAQGSPQQIVRAGEMKTIRELYDEGLPDDFWRPDLYSQGEIGRSLQLGDEAFRAGNLEEAQQHYLAAKRQIDANYDRPLRPHRDFVEDRLDLVVNTRRSVDEIADVQASVPKSDASVPIDDDSMEQALYNHDMDLMAGTAERQGGANPVWITRDDAGNVYYVKRIWPEEGNALTENLTPAQIEEILAKEAASATLAERVGLNAAGSRYDPQRQVLISRAIPSDGDIAGTLASKPEHVTMALKKEYARQRLFRAWLGDTDGHLGNMILGNDGRPYLIDFDQSIFTGSESRQIRGTGNRSAAEVVEETVTVWRHVGQDPRLVMYKWMARLDQTITYEDVRPTVEAIQELANTPGALEDLLRTAGYPNPEAAAETLIERAAELREVMQPLFDGGLRGIVSSLAPFSGGDWLAHFPVSRRPVLSSVGAIRGPSHWFVGPVVVIPRPDELRRAA